MGAPAKAHEPTMEEILASIRRIITDDDHAAAAKPAAKAAGSGPDVPAESEALGQDDIDAMFASFDAPEPPKPEPKAELAPKPAPEPEALPVPDDLDVFELTEEMAASPRPEPEPPSARAAAIPEPPAERSASAGPAPATGGDRLLSAAADSAVSNAFGSLANTILASNARTLDDIVREMLRPMLRAWLDDNLPPLVERLVRQEIERVARGGR